MLRIIAIVHTPPGRRPQRGVTALSVERIDVVEDCRMGVASLGTFRLVDGSSSDRRRSCSFEKGKKLQTAGMGFLLEEGAAGSPCLYGTH